MNVKYYVCIEFFESRLDSSASMKNMKKMTVFFQKNGVFSMNATGIFIVSSHWSENVLTRHTKEGKKLIEFTLMHSGQICEILFGALISLVCYSIFKNRVCVKKKIHTRVLYNYIIFGKSASQIFFPAWSKGPTVENPKIS